MNLQHKALVDLLRMAYSAEKAAVFAYQGHAASVKSELKKAAIKQIEIDEWNHQHKVLTIMNQYGIKPSRHYEIRFHIVRKLTSTGCHVIGWFMPFYFAGCLESSNVCEYFRMIHFFHELGIREHNQTLYEIGVKEKEHKDYFYAQIKGHKLLPLFERLFSWGDKQKFNDLNMEELLPSSRSEEYCKK
jgi:hypothetical protein